MIKLFCKNTGETRDCVEGTTLLESIKLFSLENPDGILAAKVNNVLEGLRFRVFNNLDIEFLDYGSYAGRGVYCRSLCFLLAKASQDICPGCRVIIRRPISKGYYCELRKKQDNATQGSEGYLCRGRLTQEEIAAIRERMRSIVEADTKFLRHEVRTEQAISLFRSLGYEDKVNLLESSDRIYVCYHTLSGTPDIFYSPLLPSAGYLKVWDVEPFEDGMFLRVPNRHSPDELAEFQSQPKTLESMKENLRWNEIMGLNNVGDVNIAIRKGGATDLIQISEALQEKKIVSIAEDIFSRYNAERSPIRLVLITGPSSSGKSTFCKRLSIQLKACGLHPLSVSTDDYFVDRVKTLKLPDGSYDFDNFDTVDHHLMQRDLISLLSGKEIQVPEYNFVTGIREHNGKTIRLMKDSVLLVEGIHALNPMLTNEIPDNLKYRIFINTITSISLDDHNSIGTSDNRLLRRIIRDYNKGAFSARATIANWPNVRRSEVRWIYPYQETADVLFNSAYLVEFAVIRSHAERILSTVPRNCPEYSEAHRLMEFLKYFNYVSDKEVPSTSLLRDVIGGSSL